MNLFSRIKKKPAKTIAALLFCGLLTMASSQKAFAAGIVINDSPIEDLNFVIVIAHYLDELDNWVDEHLEKLKDTLREKLKHEMEKATTTGNTNALIDNERHLAVSDHIAKLTEEATDADTETGCATILKNQVAAAVAVNNKAILAQKMGQFSTQGISTQFAAYQQLQIPIPLYNLCRLTGANFNLAEIPWAAAQNMKTNICAKVFSSAQ